MKILLPDGWKAPIGYSNGISVDAGQIVFTAEQVGQDAQQNFKSEEISSQFQQAFRNILAVLENAGGLPEHIYLITAFCIDKPADLEARSNLGKIWGNLMGKHYPAIECDFCL